MSLIKLLDNVGIDNIGYQLLSTSLTSVSDKKGHTALTFITSEIRADDVMNDTGRVGVIVWVDRDKWNDAVKTFQQNSLIRPGAGEST